LTRSDLGRFGARISSIARSEPSFQQPVFGSHRCASSGGIGNLSNLVTAFYTQVPGFVERQQVSFRESVLIAYPQVPLEGFVAQVPRAGA
jgi:hypothetical protein